MDPVFLEEISEEARTIIKDSGLTAEQLVARFTLQELTGHFKLSLLEVANLREKTGPSKRARSPPGDSASEEAEKTPSFLGLLTGDPLGVRDLLPSSGTYWERSAFARWFFRVQQRGWKTLLFGKNSISFFAWLDH